ncbi:MAG: DUF1289 domain-containing protein [Betaproteobacteria bacterium]
MNCAIREPASPCVNVCQMNPYNGLCRGCLRTLDEIAGWLELSAAEKLAVLKSLEERRRTGRPR